MRWRLAVGGAVVLALAGGAALAQGIAVPEGVPPQPILDGPGEPGAPGWAVEGAGGGEGGGGDAGAGAVRDDRVSSDVGGGGGGMGAAVAGAPVGGLAAAPIEGGSQALNTLARQPYGQAAIAAAQEAGITAEALANVARVESGFRNIPTENGSSSATGIWQVTSGTWEDTNRMDRLGFTAADRNDPAAQAVVASNVLRRYAASTQNAIGRDATVSETYYSYLLGPGYGPQVIAASNDTPMSAIVPARSLANNGLSNFTVGQFRGSVRNRFGSSADLPVMLPPS